MMSRTKSNEQTAPSDSRIDEWQIRSAVERRADNDNRRKSNRKYFITGGQERRTGTERRDPQERRERWMRVGKWCSVPVFDE